MDDVSFMDKVKISFGIMMDYMRIEFHHDPIWTLSTIISPFLFMGILVYNLAFGGIFLFGHGVASAIIFNGFVLFLMAAFSFIITMIIIMVLIFAAAGCMFVYEKVTGTCANIKIEYMMRKEKLIKTRSKKV